MCMCVCVGGGGLRLFGPEMKQGSENVPVNRNLLQ